MAVTNVSCPMPVVTLREGSTITVDVGAGGPTISQLVLHAFQVIPAAAPTRTPVLISNK